MSTLRYTRDILWEVADKNSDEIKEQYNIESFSVKEEIELRKLAALEVISNEISMMNEIFMNKFGINPDKMY